MKAEENRLAGLCTLTSMGSTINQNSYMADWNPPKSPVWMKGFPRRQTVQRANTKWRGSMPEGEGLKSLQPKSSPRGGEGARITDSSTWLGQTDGQAVLDRHPAGQSHAGTRPAAVLGWYLRTEVPGTVASQRGTGNHHLCLLSNLPCNADSWAPTKNALNLYFIYLFLCSSPFLWVGPSEDNTWWEYKKKLKQFQLPGD